MPADAERRAKLLRAAAGAAFLALAVVVVLIVVNAASNGNSGDTELEEVAAANAVFAGIPQRETVLGDPSAPVKLFEFGDLQCPVCKAFSEEVVPPIIEKQVKNGEASLTFRNFVIIGPESVDAGTAMLAAGEQGRGWNFLEIFYRNQGKERSGYVTDEFLEAVAKAAGVKDLAAWNKARNSNRLREEVAKSTGEAEAIGFTGTPSFAVEGPGTEGLESLGPVPSRETLEAAISSAS
ncbi:MAG TPA: thioredoxin domain-containing protein [Solirubrobacterales bacterium]|nr:thioredoxin domain-containing protein [Solirubrobacterales bacterium]